MMKSLGQVTVVSLLAIGVAGCVTTGGPSLTKKQKADVYYGCVALNTYAANASVGEAELMAAHEACRSEGMVYARQLALDAGAQVSWSGFNGFVATLYDELGERTVGEFMSMTN